MAFSKKEKQAYVTGKIVGAKMARKPSYRKPTKKSSVSRTRSRKTY